MTSARDSICHHAQESRANRKGHISTMTSVLRSAPPVADPPAERNQIPLTDSDAEDAVLYGSLEFRRYQHQIVELATDEVITDPKRRVILGWIRQMLTEELPVDALTVAAYVQDRGLLGAGVPRISLRTYLSTIVGGDTYLVPETVLYLLDHLHQLAARRAAVAAACEVVRVAEAADFDDLLTVVQEQMEVATAAILRSKAAAA